MNTLSNKLAMPEFFNPGSAIAVALFGMNNFYLKQQFPGWISGKLSDFAVCFFSPLFVSAISSLFLNWPFKRWLQLGSAITLAVFILVKVSPWASELLNMSLSFVSNMLGLGDSLNRIDVSDLIASPMVLISYYFGLRQERNRIK